MNERKSGRRLNDYLIHLSHSFNNLRASSITTDKIQASIQKRKAEGAANGTINRELGCLKRMFRIALQHTPPKVVRVPHIPMLEERNIRSGFFEHDEFFGPEGSIAKLRSGSCHPCIL